MKNYLKTKTCIIILALSSIPSMAAASPNSLLYISANDYSHSVRLLHPYYDYWFEQGPLVEPIAFEALKEKLPDISMCKANETADTIIRIKPSLFYNPQMRVYHGRLVATVFSGGGNVLGTYVGEAQQQGFLSVNHATQLHIQKVYAKAMQNLMSKFEIKPIERNGNAENKLPCGLVGAQEEAKINFYWADGRQRATPGRSPAGRQVEPPP